MPVGERTAYLEFACANDPGLRERVDALLRAHEKAGDFLGKFPVDAALGGGRTLSAGPGPGDRIGHYKLLQQIGEGGCGIVFMAEQHEPVRRLVALKVIKAGMDTKSVIARFEAERQALAMMDHPNIAKVLEAGATDAGRPYFVMELVRGVKITEYCDQNSLTTSARLQLFILVCEAVQHAHQKGIIHRDIKPSNILVTTTAEGKALPKVIDFGIAKATTNQRLTDKTLFTAFEMLIGTPAYMSPEQAALTSVDVDTRTDIYSLGVLLYELLTSKTPFDAHELLKAGLDEIRRVIREQEPVRPSTRLSTMAGQDLTTIAQCRRAEPPKLVRALTGDLDWIVMKALEKDRARRYQTASGMAQDIQHYVVGEAVAARPPNALYKFQKLFLRNKLLFGGLGIIAVLLVAGLGITTWLLAKENRTRLEADSARSQAEADKKYALSEAAKSRQVTQFMEDMLQGVGPSVARGRDTAMLKEILDKAAERVGKELTNQPAVEAELRSMIGSVYHELALYDKAETMHRAALANYNRLFGTENKEVAASLNNLARVLLEEGRRDEAESAFREALAIRQRIFGNEHPDVATSLQGLSEVLRRKGNQSEAVRLNVEALEMRRKVLGNDNLEVADSLHKLAALVAERGEFAQAESMEREVLAMQRKFVGDEHPMIATTLLNLNIMLCGQGKQEEAEMGHRQVLAMQRRLYGDEHPAVAVSLESLGLILQQRGKLAEAEINLREALSIQGKFLSDESPQRLTFFRHLAELLEVAGKLAEAETVYRQMLDMRVKSLGEEHLDVAESLDALANVLQAQGKLTEAETMYRRALKIRRKLLGDVHQLVADSVNKLLSLLLSQKKFGEAEQSLTMFLTPALVGNPRSVTLLNARVELFARQGRWKEAAVDASIVLEYQPTNNLAYHTLAPLLVASRDLVLYQRLCQRMMSQFAGTTDACAADRMAKDCLMLPLSEVNFQLVGNLADTAVTNGSELVAIPFFQTCKALAEYRQGRFTAAREWAQKALEGRIVFAQAEAYPVLAMAHYRLNQKDNARAVLVMGKDFVKNNLPQVDSDDFGVDWRDWIITQALIDEATALIEGKPASESNPYKK